MIDDAPDMSWQPQPQPLQGGLPRATRGRSRAADQVAAELQAAPVAARPDPAPEVPAEAPPAPPRKGGRPRGQIYDGCPVVPLGVSGDVSWYLDVLGQLRGVDGHTAQKVQHVFGGRIAQLERFAPSYDKDGVKKPGKFDATKAALVMTAACAECGVWNPVGRVRGPGAWADDDGRLIYHSGDEVLIDGTWHPPGVHGGRVYPAADPGPRPAATAGRGDAVQDLLTLLRSWAWRRGDIDAILTLGTIAGLILGGALDWRPVAWITGDAATGKSTLQKLLLHLLGGERGLLQAADATEAGIRSVVGYSSLPVAVDELEPDPRRPDKARGVIELARRAASGGVVFRGGVDQKGHQSVAQSAFLFTSILVPDMPAQDRSRLILLELDRLPPDAPRLAQAPDKWRRWGAQLRRVLIDGWPGWAARLDVWRAALAEQGQTGRGTDNYATVLALADLALHAEAPGAELLAAWSVKVARSVTDEAVEVGSNAEDMLFHLLAQQLDVWRRGRKHLVAEWVAFAARLPGAPEVLGEATDAGQANALLAPYGLRVQGRDVEARLQLATKPFPGLCDLFQNTPWANGVWGQAAARLPGAERGNTRFARNPSRCWEIPLRAIEGFMSFPRAEDRAPAPPAPGLPDDAEEFV